MIRIFFLSTVVTSLISINASAQQKPVKSNEEVVTAIRTEFKRINALPLNKEQFKYESEGCVEGGNVQYFFDKKEIVKVVESGSMGDGSWTTEFYYQSGKLIFCYEKAVGSSADGQESKIEHRVYVKGNEVVKYMEDQKVIAADAEATKKLATADKLLKAYGTKNFAGALCE
ncbi:hypothetical protein [Chitinophaga tropicalis]|uniref:Uncharacterized protein n=1 Tax=Chitinophaga tropicalis TaxID=2683588 RepID=A0A7K1U7B6_9BACT|nr:hypothetical protein [Chitinophaga tropicalis]MVT10253.1 hypothetical protein [Chitinophaga tropicalis]